MLLANLGLLPLSLSTLHLLEQGDLVLPVIGLIVWLEKRIKNCSSISFILVTKVGLMISF